MGVYTLVKETKFGRVLLPVGATTPELTDRKAEWLHDQGAIVLPGRKQVAAATSFAAPRTAPRQMVGGCCGRR